tara:strand:+ start:85 stop:825 length:741 start_codon:yes stop_codon:yes gene_type:complete
MFRTKEAPMVNNSIQVQTTNDYSLFTSLNGNRNLNKLHVKRLKESMQKKYLFTVIVINEKYEIIDGQHRFNACKELELPIRYIIVNGYGLIEVQMLNANSKNWTADDYLNGYCDLGYKDYLIYRDFKNKYGLGHNESQLLLGNKHSKGMGATFSTGEFKITQYSKACEYADHILSMKELYKGWRRRSFVYAIINLLSNENFDIEYFKNKLRVSPNSLVDCTTVPQCIILIEEVYNYRNRNKVSLRY